MFVYFAGRLNMLDVEELLELLEKAGFDTSEAVKILDSIVARRELKNS